jgi:hypothetical protein
MSEPCPHSRAPWLHQSSRDSCRLTRPQFGFARDGHRTTSGPWTFERNGKIGELLRRSYVCGPPRAGTVVKAFLGRDHYVRLGIEIRNGGLTAPVPKDGGWCGRRYA